MRLINLFFIQGVVLYLLLGSIFGCSEKSSIIHKEIPFNGEDFKIALNDSSMFEEWIYDVDGERLAVWNSAIYSVDLYNLSTKRFQKRFQLFDEGPKGIGNVEAILITEKGIVVIDPIQKVQLTINLENNEMTRIRFFWEKNSPLFEDFNLNIVPEFSSLPNLTDEVAVWPITPKEDFLSKKYYSKKVLLLNKSKMIGNWPQTYQNYYYGLLGEPSVSYSDSLIFLSFPVDRNISVFDFEGNKKGSFPLSSPNFKKYNGMSRSEPDLQEETNLTITKPWFLKTIYGNDKLIRFEKQAQELKNPDGKLNSKLFGQWKILWKSLSELDTIYHMDLPKNKLFLPISFPYKGGVLVKNINDETESFADFTYIRLDN